MDKIFSLLWDFTPFRSYYISHRRCSFSLKAVSYWILACQYSINILKCVLDFSFFFLSEGSIQYFWLLTLSKRKRKIYISKHIHLRFYLSYTSKHDEVSLLEKKMHFVKDLIIYYCRKKSAIVFSKNVFVIKFIFVISTLQFFFYHYWSWDLCKIKYCACETSGYVY